MRTDRFLWNARGALFSFFLIGVLLSHAAPAKADIVVSTIPPLGLVYEGGATLEESGTALAGQFIPLVNYVLTDAQVVVENDSGFATFDLSLNSNTANGNPGSVIQGLGAFVTAPAGISTQTVSVSGPGTILLAGTPYWLVMTSETGSPILWFGGRSDPNSDYANMYPGEEYNGEELFNGQWSNGPGPAPLSFQFQIDGTPVVTPEPGNVFLVATIFALMVCLRLRWKAADPGQSRAPTQ
jgi:hypothetical protein